MPEPRNKVRPGRSNDYMYLFLTQLSMLFMYYMCMYSSINKLQKIKSQNCGCKVDHTTGLI
jgi:hypothetical protein